jgi:hypothetical protein
MLSPQIYFVNDYFAYFANRQTGVLFVCLFIYYLFIILVVLLVIIYRVLETLVRQRIHDLKVETKSWLGGNIFGDRWKDFHGRVERFSWTGGNFFVVRWKENQGKK